MFKSDSVLRLSLEPLRYRLIVVGEMRVADAMSTIVTLCSFMNSFKSVAFMFLIITKMTLFDNQKNVGLIQYG